MNSITEMVKNKKVRFKYYRENKLYYETECGFVFPVEIEDTGTASFLAEDKAILFMRWIGKAVKEIKDEDALLRMENE